MEDFKFTPDEVQPVSSNEDLGFSFTPDEVQPDFTKVHLSDVKNSNDPVGVLTQSAKSIATMLTAGGIKNPITDAAFNVTYNVGKGIMENKELVGEYISELPITTIKGGMALGEKAKEIYTAVDRKMEEDELYQFKEDTVASGLKELPKAIANEVAVTTPKMMSDLSFWLSKNMVDPDGKDNSMSEGFAKLSKTLDNVSKRMGDVEMFKSTAINLPSGRLSWGNIFEAAGHGMGQGAVMGTVARVLGPKTAYGLYAGAGGAGVFKESYEKEGDLGKANTLASITTATTYMVDRWLDPIPENIAKGAKLTAKEIANDIAQASMREPLAETLQQVYAENLVRKIGIDGEQELFEGLVEVAISAIAGGGTMAVAGGVGGYIAEKSYERAKQKALDKGASESEVEQYKAATLEKLKHHVDIFDAKFQANAEKAYQDINAFVEENGSEEEVRKALEKKQQLDAIYNDTYNELKNIMPEQEAKSNAALIRNSAFFFAEEFGISPEEFVKQRGVKVVKSDYNSFNSLDGDFIPFQFAGPNAKTAALDNLNIAKQFETEGVDNEAIRQQTGWFKGPDNKWRFEISDEDAVMLGTINELKAKREADNEKLMKKISKLQKKRDGLLPKVNKGEISEEEYYASLDKIDKEMGDIYNNRAPLKVKDILQHDKLFAAYPEIAEINVYISDNIEPNSAYFSKKGRSITVGADVAKADANSLELKGVIMHEIQHAIQDNEGFATGGSPEQVNDIKRILELNAEASEEMERIEFFNKKLGSEEKTKELLHKEWLANKALRESLDKTGDFSDEAMEINDKYIEFVEELGLTKEDMKESYNTPSKKLYEDVRLSDAYDVYWRLYGEVEARNTAKRSEFSDKLRKEISPERTQDVKNTDAIVMFSDGTVAAYNPEKVRVEDGVVDLSDAFDGTPTAQKVREYLKEVLDKGNEFKTLSKDWIIDVINNSRTRGHVSISNNWKNMSPKQRREHNKYATAFEKLINNARYLGSEVNKKKDEKPYVEKYHYFATTVRINKHTFNVILDTEQFIGENEDKPQTVHLYNLEDESVKRSSLIKNTKTSSNASSMPQFLKKFKNFFFQSAFAGSRVDYDRPSLEAIGSGEGAQVHGWGLYYALKREVAERYRKAFIRSERETVFPGSREEVAIETYLKNNKDKQATIKELSQMEKEAQSKLGTPEEDVLAYVNISQAVDYMRYIDDATLEQQTIELENSEKGQVHEVDIPENPYLLEEHELLDNHSDIVKKGIADTLNELKERVESGKYPDYVRTLKDMDYDYSGIDKKFADMGFYKYKSGKQIYNIISEIMGSDKDASLLLEKHGVKGITYIGEQDGRCFVIFNHDDVKVIQKFYQDGANDPKGAYVNRIIHLFQNADASTLPHELAHFWKDTLKDAAKMSKRAAKMLEDVEKWAEQEFNRKYSVQIKDGRYVANNKQGLTVYDHNFRTIEDAKSYAQEELFAQGFEMYLKEGKAPNNSLKQAFRNFLMWLKHIYKQAKQLDIRLSPDMRNVYADILGGTDIDFFLNADPDTFIENRIKLDNETKIGLDRQIEEAQRMGVKVSDPDGRRLKDVWEKSMIPLSTRLGRISNELKNRLRRYEFDITNSLNKYYDEARPFLQKWKNFSEMDAIAFDIALKNDYVEKQLQIVDKYGAREEWEKIRKLLLDIYDSAIKAGLDVNFRPDYFPRKVKDAKGLLAYLRGTEEWTKFQEALREADPDNVFTEEEQADFINKYLRGFVKVDLMPYKYSSEKQRKIERINNEMNKYYAPSMESLVSYIEGMNARIKASEFLGRDAEKLEESIGGYLTYLLDNNKIDPTKVDEVREILQARFNQKGVGNKFIAGMRDISYMYTMGGINSAITQIEDLSVSMYKAGVWNTLTTAFENKKIKRADLGLDKISAEFVENPSKTSRGVEKLFKLTGLDKIDSFGKETLVNAMVKKFKQMSENSLRQYLEPIMEQETNQTIQDIKNGVMSDNVLYLVFSELSDVQPISLSELPAFYNTSGNLRVLYMLKSFMVKRIDIFRNECFDKLRSGNKEARIQGMQNLFRLAILMIACGATKDWIINMLYGRDIDVPEILVNNALGLVGFSKFHAYQFRDKGAGEVIKDFLMPPLFAMYDDLLGDIFKIGSGKRDLKDAEILKGLPLAGRFYYWHIGRGKEKMNKRKNKLK